MNDAVEFLRREKSEREGRGEAKVQNEIASLLIPRRIAPFASSMDSASTSQPAPVGLPTNALGIDISPLQTAAPSILAAVDSTYSATACKFKWAGGTYSLSLQMDTDTVGDLKDKIWSLTNVPPERQKLLGLGRVSGEHYSVASLTGNLTKNGGLKDFMLVGTPVGLEAVGNSSGDDSPEFDYTADQIQTFKTQQNIRNQCVAFVTFDRGLMCVVQEEAQGSYCCGGH